jgi:hypothetical protein
VSRAFTITPVVLNRVIYICQLDLRIQWATLLPPHRSGLKYELRDVVATNRAHKTPPLAIAKDTLGYWE